VWAGLAENSRRNKQATAELRNDAKGLAIFIPEKFRTRSGFAPDEFKLFPDRSKPWNQR